MTKFLRRTGSLVLSDVDGTLVRGSLVLGHAVSLHRDGRLNLGNLPEKWIADQKNETVMRDLAESYREEIRGATPDELGAADYIQRLSKDESNFYSTLGRLRKIRSSGARVVLISGSPSFLVEEFGNTYGFEGVGSNYITDDDGRLTGECVGMFHAAAKRDFVKTLGIERYRKVWAFGDTQSDGPLFESATYSVLVEPNNETRDALVGRVDEIVLS